MSDLISRSAIWEMLEMELALGITNDDIADAFRNAPAVDAMPKWISVEERLPGAKGPYLVCGEHWIAGSKTITTICFWWGDRWDRDKVFEITHWMPLPEPPKEDT